MYLSANFLGLGFLFLVSGLCETVASAGHGQYVQWSKENCNPLGDPLGSVKGSVVDAVCVRVDLNRCLSITNETACNFEDRCIWTFNDRCDLNRDFVNNVCAEPGSYGEKCNAISKGRCPRGWEIPLECCPSPYNNYVGILRTSHERLVCCNAPCTAIEAAWESKESGTEKCSAEMAPQCGPQGRSMIKKMMGLMGGGFNQELSPSAVNQMLGFSSGKSQKLGRVKKGFGGLSMSDLVGMFGMGGGMGMTGMGGMGGPGMGMSGMGGMGMSGMSPLGMSGMSPLGLGGLELLMMDGGSAMSGLNAFDLLDGLGIGSGDKGGKGTGQPVKDEQVEEVTIDDLMETLLDVLDEEDNLFNGRQNDPLSRMLNGGFLGGLGGSGLPGMGLGGSGGGLGGLEFLLGGGGLPGFGGSGGGLGGLEMLMGGGMPGFGSSGGLDDMVMLQLMGLGMPGLGGAGGGMGSLDMLMGMGGGMSNFGGQQDLMGGLPGFGGTPSTLSPNGSPRSPFDAWFGSPGSMFGAPPPLPPPVFPAQFPPNPYPHIPPGFPADPFAPYQSPPPAPVHKQGSVQHPVHSPSSFTPVNGPPPMVLQHEQPAHPPAPSKPSSGLGSNWWETFQSVNRVVS